MGDFKRLDALLKKFADETVPGCACVVMKKEEVLHEGYAGWADAEQKRPIDPKSVFRQASTTKLFTYAIMGMLYEEGRFLFSDPIGEYLPEWKHTTKWIRKENGEVEVLPLERPITVRDAAAMMCGLPYCMFPEPAPKDLTVKCMSEKMKELLAKGTPTLREEVRQMAEVPVRFEPGTHWLYGYGSEIIGALVEELTGKSLRANFAERLIEPLGLKDTGTFLTDYLRKGLVRQYEKKEGRLFPVPEEEDMALNATVTPEGARPQLICSAKDFAIFMNMLANGGVYDGKRYLAEGTVRLLASDQLDERTARDFQNTYLAGYGYGLGFRVLKSQAQGFHNGHPGAFGWTGGTGIWAEADPVSGVSIVYMHNMRPNEELYHHHRIRNVVYADI